MRNIYWIIGVCFLFSCSQKMDKADAYGNFEADEYVISAEQSGRIMELNLNEGDYFQEASVVGYIDSIQTYLQKQELIAKRKSISAGISNILSRVEVLKEQLNIAKKEQVRIQNMFTDGAATQKELDQGNGNVDVIVKQIQSVQTENANVFAQLEEIDQKVKALNDLLRKCKIHVPESATVLEQYCEKHEMVQLGKPLFQLANLKDLDLRVYIDGSQLNQFKIGQKVDVIIDKTSSENRVLEGVVSWISSQSEFTPKIIQTKKERVKLVYAMKVRVKNDGSLKIGMPGEIRIRN